MYTAADAGCAHPGRAGATTARSVCCTPAGVGAMYSTLETVLHELVLCTPTLAQALRPVLELEAVYSTTGAIA